MADLESLRAERLRQDQILKQARDMQRVLENRCRMRRARAPKDPLHVAKGIIVMSGGVVRAATQWCREKKLPEAYTLAVLEEWLLEASVEDLASLADICWKLTSADAKVALRYVRDWEVATWVDQKNVNEGEAPSYADAYWKFRALHATDAEPLPSEVGSIDAANQWGRRFRKRHGLHRGQVETKPVDSTEELQKKVHRGI